MLYCLFAAMVTPALSLLLMLLPPVFMYLLSAPPCSPYKWQKLPWESRQPELVESLTLWPGATVLRNLCLFTWPEQVMDEERCSFTVTSSHPTLPFPLILPLSLLKTGCENVHWAELVHACLDSVPPRSWSGLLDGTAELIHSLMWESIMAVLGIEIQSARFCVCIIK